MRRDAEEFHIADDILVPRGQAPAVAEGVERGGLREPDRRQDVTQGPAVCD